MFYVKVWEQRKRDDHIILDIWKKTHHRTNSSLNVAWLTLRDRCKSRH